MNNFVFNAIAKVQLFTLLNLIQVKPSSTCTIDHPVDGGANRQADLIDPRFCLEPIGDFNRLQIVDT